MNLSRRGLLEAAALRLLAGARGPVPVAICSETFTGSTFADACKAARRCGYDGIEIEPAQLAPDPAALSAAERRRARRAMREEGLGYPGLHSFLKSPPGLHLTTSDRAVRERSWDYFRRMVELAADLGDRPVMVLGSARQRAAAGGVTPQEAIKRLQEGLAALAPAAERRKVTILMEPLAPQLCNVVNTLEEAMEIVRAVNSPAVQTILDTHNTAGEKRTPAELLRAYRPYIRHVHLNEMDGKRPGLGDFPFLDVLRVLKEIGYRYWVSVEVFDFKPDGVTVACEARRFLRGLEANL